MFKKTEMINSLLWENTLDDFIEKMFIIIFSGFLAFKQLRHGLFCSGERTFKTFLCLLKTHLSQMFILESAGGANTLKNVLPF